MPDVMTRLRDIFTTQPESFQMSPMIGPNVPSSDIGMSGRMQGSFEPSINFGDASSMDAGRVSPTNNRMNELYTPQTEFQDRYRSLLDQMPERNDPSIWRRLGALFHGGLGGGNSQEQMKFLYAPYLRNLEDFDVKMKALEPGLNAERAGNINERQIASNILTNESTNRRLDIAAADQERKEREGEEKLRQNEEKIKIQRQRAETYRFRTENPNAEIREDASGNLIAINPQTKKVEYLLDDEGQPIKGNSVSEFDKIKLQIQGRKEVIAAQTAADLNEEAVRQRNRIALEREQGEQARQTKTTNPDEGKVETTTSSVTVKDAEGNPRGTRTTTTQRSTQSGNNVGVKMQLPPTKKYPRGRIALVPKSDVEKVRKAGGKVVP